MQWTAERIERFWNNQALTPEDYFTYRFGRFMLRRFGRWLKDRKTILDYGCGTGFLIGHMLEEMGGGAQVFGSDISENSLAQVTRRYGKHPSFCGVFGPEQLIKNKQRFEVVLLIETIEHLNDDNLESVFNDIKKLLQPEGVLIVTTPNNEDLKTAEMYCPACDHTFHRWQHVRSWNPGSLSAFLHDAGFNTESVLETDFSFDRRSFKAQAKRLLKRLLRRALVKPHLMAVARVA